MGLSVLDLVERKKALRKELSSKPNNASIDLEDLRLFIKETAKKRSTWAWFSSLSDEPKLKNPPADIKLCSPKTHENELNFFMDETVTQKAKSSLGVLEPADGEQVKPNQIDLVLIPGLAFDSKGNRLGRGKGFYDRFLENYKGLKVGVCSKNRFVDFPLPIDSEKDVSVDLILTEDFIYQPAHAQKKVV